jgi:hypothetical protein
MHVRSIFCIHTYKYLFIQLQCVRREGVSEWGIAGVSKIWRTFERLYVCMQHECVVVSKWYRYAWTCVRKKISTEYVLLLARTHSHIQWQEVEEKKSQERQKVECARVSALGVSVRVRVRVRVCVRVCVCVCAPWALSTCVHICVYIHTYILTYVHTYVHRHGYTCFVTYRQTFVCTPKRHIYICCRYTTHICVALAVSYNTVST